MKKKETWLLDDNILLHGYKDKYGFHPDKEIPCGFSCQKLWKKDKDKIYFFSLKKAMEIYANIPVAAGKCTIRCAIDNGMAYQKLVIGIGDIVFCEKRKPDNAIEDFILKTLSENRISIKNPYFKLKCIVQTVSHDSDEPDSSKASCCAECEDCVQGRGFFPECIRFGFTVQNASDKYC